MIIFRPDEYPYHILLLYYVHKHIYIILVHIMQSWEVSNFFNQLKLSCFITKTYQVRIKKKKNLVSARSLVRVKARS